MGGNVKVHRLMYELVNKQDITGLVVRHVCDNIKCINPDHLEVGTFGDNNTDRSERGRSYRTTTPQKVIRTNQLLATNALSNKEIAAIVGLDPRRVSDIKRGFYSATGKFLGRG
jgi:predicted XRE-type DNA-binding protein